MHAICKNYPLKKRESNLMPKRANSKRRGVFDMESDPSSGSDEETSGSFNVFPTPTRQTKKGKGPLVPREDGADDDTEFEEMIRRSITRRDVKAGTEFLKSRKGKKRLTKDEVGGGSFQSMGTST